MSSSMK
jgi:ribosome maturation protein SDO1